MNLELNTIYNEDCLEGMNRIPDSSLEEEYHKLSEERINEHKKQFKE